MSSDSAYRSATSASSSSSYSSSGPCHPALTKWRDPVLVKLMKKHEERKVVLDIEVSHTEHAHIIGRKGSRVKRVMKETSNSKIFCPNMNICRYSNEVSIYGDIEGVERARAMVRRLTPLEFTFPVYDDVDIKIIDIRIKTLMDRPDLKKVHAMVNKLKIVTVQGFEEDSYFVQKATQMLINTLCGHYAENTYVTLTMRISPQYQRVVRGYNDNISSSIMYYTHTRIAFSESKQLRNSWVKISGDLRGVLAAKRMIIGSLPMTLIFDIDEKTRKDVDEKLLLEMQQNFGVSVDFEYLPDIRKYTCILTALERNANDIYETRRLIMGYDEPAVEAVLPLDYFIPNNLDFRQKEEFNSEYMSDDLYESVSMIDQTPYDQPQPEPVQQELQEIPDYSSAVSNYLDFDQQIVYLYHAHDMSMPPAYRPIVKYKVTALRHLVGFEDRKAPGWELKVLKTVPF